MIIQTRRIRQYEPRLGQFFFLEGSNVPVKIVKEIGGGNFVILVGNSRRSVSYKQLRSEIDLPVLAPGLGKGFIRQEVNFTSGTDTVTEGDDTLAVVGIPVAQTKDVIVHYSVEHLSTVPADISYPASPMTIAAGDTEQTLSIDAINLDGAEPEEAFILHIDRVENAIRGETIALVLRVAASGT